MFCPIWHVQYALWLGMLMYGIHCNGFPRPPAQLTSSRRAVAPAALDVGGRLTMSSRRTMSSVLTVVACFRTRLPPHPAPRGDARTEVLSRLGTARVVCSALRTSHVNIKLYMYKNVCHNNIEAGRTRVYDQHAMRRPAAPRPVPPHPRLRPRPPSPRRRAAGSHPLPRASPYMGPRPAAAAVAAPLSYRRSTAAL